MAQRSWFEISAITLDCTVKTHVVIHYSFLCWAVTGSEQWAPEMSVSKLNLDDPDKGHKLKSIGQTMKLFFRNVAGLLILQTVPFFVHLESTKVFADYLFLWTKFESCFLLLGVSQIVVVLYVKLWKSLWQFRAFLGCHYWNVCQTQRGHEQYAFMLFYYVVSLLHVCNSCKATHTPTKPLWWGPKQKKTFKLKSSRTQLVKEFCPFLKG